MPIEVRAVTADEVAAWVDAMALGFLRPPAQPGEVDFRRQHMDLARSQAAVDGGAVVGTLRSFATELTVPGGATVAVSALTNVTVRPSHRRRGVLSRMLDLDLRASAERGEVASILIASEYPIYGRYGYGPATEHAEWEIDAAAARFRQPTIGSVEIVEVPVARGIAPDVYEHHRRAQPGAIARQPMRWDLDFGIVEIPGRPHWRGRVAIHRNEHGHADGYVAYHVEERWEHRRGMSTLVVDELLGATPAVEASLWQLCCDMDLIATVRAADRRADEPLPWLLEDGRAARQVGRSDFLWVRLLDTAAALTARRYGGAGRLVLEVVDAGDHGGRSGGRFALESGDGGAACEATTDEPDLVVPVDIVGAAWLGGPAFRTMADAGRLEERRPGAVDLADALFHTPAAPWCNTWF